MTLKVTGIEETSIRLQREGDKLAKGSLDKMRTYMHKMIRSARDNAPIKDGYLENSIEFLGEEVGARGRKSIIWGVNPSKLGPGYKKNGVRYDIKMEIGDFNKLGQRSLEKMEDGYDVGEGYITRAVWEWEDELLKELRLMAKKVR